MQAVVYDAYGSVEQLVLRDLPAPIPRRGELVVQVRCAALNPKDALFRKGRFRLLSGRRFPKRCGLDFAGLVVDSRSPHFAAGERVFGALDEWTFLRGTLGERVCVRDHEAAALPHPVSNEAGAAIALAGLTALQALRDIARLRAGARVLIHGASGGVGTAAIQVARRLGAEVVTTSSGLNLELCRGLGAARALDHATDPLANLTGQLDVVFDVFGNLTPPRVRPLFAARGVLVSTVPSVSRFVRDRLTRLARVQERLVVVRPRRADLAQLARWLEEGALKPVIDSRFPLSKVQDAFRLLESRHARGKIIVEIS
jgi:NADPH:quinone reductase-like Zn-dependent oxidoreductase